MLAIKLKKIGKKNQPSFRLVVSEKRSKVTGRYVEDLGWLNPKSKEFKVNAERANYWIKSGAQPTDTVHNLLVKSGVIKGPKIAVHAKSKKVPVEQAPAQPIAEIVASAEEAPAENVEETKEEKTEIPAETQEAQ
ncbi:MAG: 30S ribosomal protein S16 [Spirochaetota bacterium]